jgi:opacity protein-like surface antigen
MKKPLIGVTVAVLAASGASAAMAAVPGVTSEGTASPKVKPKTIIYSGDGSAFFAGSQKVSKTNFGSLQWSKWNSTKALGSGGNWLNDCKPHCFNGKFHGYPVTLKLTRPRTVEGFNVFTRLLVTYTGKVPMSTPKSQTWKLGHSGKAFFWHFPPQ